MSVSSSISGGGFGSSGAGVSGLSTADGGTPLADNKVIRGDGTTGIQGSAVTIDDSGNIGMAASSAILADQPTFKNAAGTTTIADYANLGGGNFAFRINSGDIRFNTAGFFVGQTTNRVKFTGGGGLEIYCEGSGGSNDLALALVSDSLGSNGPVTQVLNLTTAPTSNPVGGPVFYGEAGALKARGTGGTVATLCAAEPHCPDCGRDFVYEAQNDAYGHLRICMWCRTAPLRTRLVLRVRRLLRGITLPVGVFLRAPA